MNFSGLLRHNEEKIKQQEAASEAAGDGTDTVHKWNHVFPHIVLLP